jgi:hypothetical protein
MAGLNRKALLAGGIAVACSVVGFAALGGSNVRKVAIAEVASAASGPMQVYGALDRKSIRAIRSSTLVSFDLLDDKTHERLSVLYDNPSTGLPVNFPTASHAMVTGVYDPTQKKLISDKVNTKCPTKEGEQQRPGSNSIVYGDKGKLDPETEKALAEWKKATGQKPSSN